VLGFFVLVWIALAAILLKSPQIYDSAVNLGRGAHPLADLAFLISISVLIAVLAFAVVRKWRWAFWLLLVAFLFGLVRVLASVLQLSGLLPAGGPAWYVALQAVIGVVQFLIALAMIAGFRKAGPWGAF
jgi:predicted ferric reductase